MNTHLGPAPSWFESLHHIEFDRPRRGLERTFFVWLKFGDLTAGLESLTEQRPNCRKFCTHGRWAVWRLRGFNHAFLPFSELAKVCNISENLLDRCIDLFNKIQCDHAYLLNFLMILPLPHTFHTDSLTFHHLPLLLFFLKEL